jgi:hypothetical protein
MWFSICRRYAPLRSVARTGVLVVHDESAPDHPPRETTDLSLRRRPWRWRSCWRSVSREGGFSRAACSPLTRITDPATVPQETNFRAITQTRLGVAPPGSQPRQRRALPHRRRSDRDAPPLRRKSTPCGSRPASTPGPWCSPSRNSPNSWFPTSPSRAFRRGTGRIRTDHAGVGLGPAIVNSIGQAHDGTPALTPRTAGGCASRCDYPPHHRTVADDRPAAVLSPRSHVARRPW